MATPATHFPAITAAVARRWADVDWLLPAPLATDDCGAGLAAVGGPGGPAAVGTCMHWEGSPGSLDITWGTARRFLLTPLVGGPDVAGGLDGLLARWRDHLAGLPDAADEDSAAVVSWPSRDVAGPAALLRHGFAPRAVIAARPAGHHPAWPAGVTADPVGWQEAWRAELARQQISIRRAGPADIDAAVTLGMTVVSYDAHFGAVIERPGSAAALEREMAQALADDDCWAWLAERDGEPAGMLHAQRPEAAQWIAPLVSLTPVCYLELLGVRSRERGRGIGAALTAALHATTDAAGVGVTLLHYAQVNPLSAPFWSQQGYRPLWTIWEARPAATVR